ncbi:MAG: Gfo/Idh/MocA family oxidoreductase [Planctomycetota bacterium]
MTIDRRSFVKTSVGLAGGMLGVTAIAPAFAESLGRFTKPLRVGVIGCGRQGRAIISELATFDGIELVGLCDTQSRRLAAAQRRAKGVPGFASHAECLDKASPDAVFIATPTHLHRNVAEDALSANVSVYCEAPLAHTAEDARAIVKAANASNASFHSGYLARTNPIYKHARTFFRSDAVRDLVSMQASRARKTKWRSPARDAAQDKLLNWRLDPEVTTGLAGEWTSHQLDVFTWYTGRFPVSVQGQGSVRLHDDGRTVHDTITCTLTLDRGEPITCNATLANSFEGTHEQLRGTNAAIKLAETHGWMFKEADAPTQGWEVYANRQQFHNDEGIALVAGATQLAEQGRLGEGIGLARTPLWYGIESFLRAVSEEIETECTAADGLRSTIVGIKTHEAVTSGTTVTIDPSELA